MDLLLWRHAQAADGTPDRERALTARGHAQARVVAAFLGPQLPDGLRVLSSPARRARETAAALGLEVEVVDGIAPDAAAADLLAAAGWPGSGGAVMLVGHQPTLGQCAALLLAGAEDDWHLAKGACWWLRAKRGAGRAGVRLVLAVGPKQLTPTG